MEITLFKIILCSAVLLLFYKLFLESEKVFRFNRFYLLGAVIISYIFPIVNLSLPTFNNSKVPLIFEETIQNTSLPQTQTTEFYDWSIIILVGYILISIVLLTKFLVSVVKIVNLQGEIKMVDAIKVKIVPGLQSPFSFLNTIYLSPKHDVGIEANSPVLLHEKIHIIQKHSWDILLIETFIVLSWINPVLYFYKKAILTNHEFIADEMVLRHHINVKYYQNLILSEIRNDSHYPLTNTLNYINTKKRFIMMTTPKSKLAGLKIGLSALTVAGAFVVFSNKVYAEVPKDSKMYEAPQAIRLIEQSLTKDPFVTPPKVVKVPKDTLRSGAPPTPPIPPTPVSKPTSETVIASPPAFNVTNSEPEFPGGMNAFRQKIMSLFNTMIFSGNEGLMKTEINFKVNVDGSTTDFTVNGKNEIFNKEALRCVMIAAQSANWKPATVDGSPVQKSFRLPLTFSFDSSTTPK